MLRLLWYLFVGYVVWKIIQWTLRVVSGPERPKPSVPPPPGKKASSARDFSDIRDAEFEDITPDKETKPGNKRS